MSEFSNIKSIPLSVLQERIRQNQNNPSAMFSVAGNFLQEVTNNEVAFFDPTNPAVMLLEFGATMTAAAINENIVNLRKANASLAEKPSDLYYEMSDVDYANRFATPGVQPITLMIGQDALLRDMVRDDEERCRKAVIPRDSYFKAGPYTFTLLYPIVIRYYDSGSLEFSYDTTIKSPFQELETNIISYTQVKTADDTSMLLVEIPVHQLEINTSNSTISKSAPFTMEIAFQDHFFYARAFHKSSSTAGWAEIVTTHSDFVFDRRTPTLLLEVDNGLLKAKLPIVYTTEGMTGEIMVLVYTTKGAVSDTLGSYDFTTHMRAIDTERDLTKFTQISLRSVPLMALSGATMTGGKNSLDFEQLRERVIFNAQGPQQLPITTAQAQVMLENEGFGIVREVDVTTARVFLANQSLPKPRDPRLITSANIGIDTFVTDKESIAGHPYVAVKGKRWTLLPKNLYTRQNGVIRLMSRQEIQNIDSMEITAKVNYLNDNNFLYSPFHYVFDNQSTLFGLRAYYIDKPSLGLVNFVRQNTTLQLPVNTAKRSIVRTEQGFRLTITTKSGNNYKNLPDGQVGAQLMFYPSGDTLPVYIKGVYLGRDSSEERRFAFEIHTSYDFDYNSQTKLHRIEVLGVGVFGSTNQNVWSDLKLDVHIFHNTNSRTVDYVRDASNNLFGAFQYTEGFVPISHESIPVQYGHSLDNLWTRSRSLTTGYNYQRHLYDIPLLYDRDVYETDATGGMAFTIVNEKAVFNKLHSQGDPVVDSEGEPIYKYRSGQPVIDPVTNTPILMDMENDKKEVDMLFIDGRHYFVNDSAYLAYNQELVDTLVTWITEDLSVVERRLMDQTKIFFYPQSQLGYIDIETSDGFIQRINSEQSPKIDLYVKQEVLNNDDVRQTIERNTIRVLDDHLSRREINVAEITEALRAAYGDSVVGFDLEGFGGVKKNLPYAILVKETQRATLRRVLEIQADRTLIMVEDVEINFLRVHNKR